MKASIESGNASSSLLKLFNECDLEWACLETRPFFRIAPLHAPTHTHPDISKRTRYIRTYPIYPNVPNISTRARYIRMYPHCRGAIHSARSSNTISTSTLAGRALCIAPLLPDSVQFIHNQYLSESGAIIAPLLPNLSAQ